MKCGIDHYELIRLNKDREVSISCPDCYTVLRYVRSSFKPQVEPEFRESFHKLKELEPLTPVEELAKIHASMISGDYVRRR